MRPGLLTWKCDPLFQPQESLSAVFVRAYGASLGPVRSAAELSARLTELSVHGLSGPLRLHVFARDGHKPGDLPAGEVEAAPDLRAITGAIVAAAPAGLLVPGPAQREGEWVLDVVVPPGTAADPVPLGDAASEPWLLGLHRHGPAHSPYAGGRPSLRLPDDAPSRAWLKLEEGLAFSGLPLRAGQVAVEIGSAPGGASWALLSRGLHVVGVDPGAMDGRVLACPRFAHVQRTMGDLRREQLPPRVDWLLLDVNLAPQVALHQLRRIVSTLRMLRGALLTLKLNDWGMAEQVPRFLAQVQAMGFESVRATQLASNRQEICIAASRSRLLIK
jgi:23S rRNA (cytidine2498-2'-O)-methyltransferase